MTNLNITKQDVHNIFESMHGWYGNRFAMNNLQHVQKDKLVDIWIKTIGHYSIRVISEVMDDLQTPNGKYLKYPPTLLELNTECFNYIDMLSMDQAEINFFNTFRARRKQVSEKFSLINHRNKEEEFWARLEEREPNLVTLTQCEIDLIERTEPTYQYEDHYVKFLVEKYGEQELSKNFQVSYKKHLKEYIANYKK